MKWMTMVAAGVLVMACAFVTDAEARRGGHGHGGHGGHGGSQGSPSVSAPSIAAPSTGPSSADGGALTQGYMQDVYGPQGNGATLSPQDRTERDTKLALDRAGHYGLVQVVRINVDGSFTYSGYEWAVAAFAREMQKMGYEMGPLGRESTDFGGSPAYSTGDLIAP